MPSKLADEFLALYRKCRIAPTESAFEQAYANLSIRAKCSITDESDNEESDNEEAQIRSVEQELAEELDDIV